MNTSVVESFKDMSQEGDGMGLQHFPSKNKFSSNQSNGLDPGDQSTRLITTELDSNSQFNSSHTANAVPKEDQSRIDATNSGPSDVTKNETSSATQNECTGPSALNKSSKQVDKVSALLEKLNLYQENCGFTLKDFYKFGLKFYKDKSGKAVHLSYEDNCYFVALSQQIIHGPFNPATAETLGVLDVVGRDRRLAWQSLGNLSKEDAMNQFVERLNQLTPTFRPYIEAVLADHMEKERLKKEAALKLEEEEEERRKQEELIKKEEEERKKQEETKRQIQEALNQQTFSQFKLYSEQQFPGNPEQQGVLIKQLQEQHYQQYMQQVYQQQLLQQQKVEPTHLNQVESEPPNTSEPCEGEHSGEESPTENGEGIIEEEIHIDEEGNERVIAPAHMWTRKDIKDFKASIRQEGGDSIIKIGHGETVTVRVPTHPEGACLFWEFATDSYDIGFGVIFEWRKDAASTGVTVHVTDSDDEDDDDEDEEAEETQVDDIERVAGTRKGKEPPKHPQSVIIPVYRRDSHDEVYSGSHCYPGSGVYLLKFDNSYSLWRNKMLYYRVYYTQR